MFDVKNGIPTPGFGPEVKVIFHIKDTNLLFKIARVIIKTLIKFLLCLT